MRSGIAGVTRPKERARASYDRLSSFYDLLTFSERKCIEAGLEMLSVSPGERVLEIGFGTGRAVLAIAEAVGDSGEVRGIDISKGMCEVARRRLTERGLEHRAELLCGDATSLIYDDGSFDAVFASFTLELFDTPEIPQVLSECARVLVPEGRICIVSMSDRAEAGEMVRLYMYAHRRLQNYFDCRPIPSKLFLESARFEIVVAREMSVWRLPVDVVLAQGR